MKRSRLIRKTPLTASAGLARAQLTRTVKRATRRHSDGPWRALVMGRRGEVCRVCGSTAWVQCAHIWPKGQGGPSVIENGIALCELHHTAYDSSRLQLRRSHLDPDQILWLAAQGWVRWAADGTTSGRGMNHFAPTTSGNQPGPLKGSTT